jgi:serine/threonine protein kinase
MKEFVLQQLKSNDFQHVHLMPALAAFEHGKDYFFILFELAESTLCKLLAGDGTNFSPQELWKQVRGLASGLAYLHGISVEGDEQNNGRMIHRDLKPANVLIVNSVMKIADFGLASYRPWPTTTDSRPTEGSIHEGMNHYSPPPSDETCEKDDVYSLGAIISEIACFDIGKGSRVAEYRQKRFVDSAGGQDNPSRRFYYYGTSDMKESVAEEHNSLLEKVREESKSPHTSLDPWQEFFFQEALFEMIESMLDGSKEKRPKAADVADKLREYSQRADNDVEQNADDRTEHHVVNTWLQTLITAPRRPAELQNRL